VHSHRIVGIRLVIVEMERLFLAPSGAKPSICRYLRWSSTALQG
jgi:hypothetical protein